MSVIEDVKASFQAKGFTFVSLAESSDDPEKSTLTYTDGAGKTVSKRIAIRLSELEDTVDTVDLIDPEELADFLLNCPA